MDRSDVIEKIEKCLALGSSPNEHEARTALLMARSLMAKWKISESEVHDKHRRDVIEMDSGLTFSKRRKSHLGSLSYTIATNMCCESYNSHRYKSKTYSIFICGYENDVRAVISALHLADAAISAAVKGMDPSAAHNYAMGFTTGLNKAFMEQNSSNSEWGLVLTVPPEVAEITRGLDGMGWDPVDGVSATTTQFRNGVKDGYNHLNPRLEGSA